MAEITYKRYIETNHLSVRNMESFSLSANRTEDTKEFALDELSNDLQISQQTLVRWVDRHLIDASLGWTLTEDNEELRVIRIAPDKIDALKSFAAEYREGRVTRKEARRILKMIDRKKVKKMVRAGDIETVTEDDETKVVIGSIEDYLMRLEEQRSEDDE